MKYLGTLILTFLTSIVLKWNWKRHQSESETESDSNNHRKNVQPPRPTGKHFSYTLRLFTLASVRCFEYPDFRLEVVRQLISSLQSVDLLPQHAQRRSSVDTEPLLRLVVRHFPASVPCSDKKEHPQRKCVVCNARKIRKESIYWCCDWSCLMCGPLLWRPSLEETFCSTWSKFWHWITHTPS